MELMFPVAKDANVARERPQFGADTPPQRSSLNFQGGAAPCPEHTIGMAKRILGKVLVAFPYSRATQSWDTTSHAADS